MEDPPPPVEDEAVSNMAGTADPEPSVEPSNGACEQQDAPDGVFNEESSQASTTKPKKKSKIFGTSSNLVNSIVGAGIIGIPYAMKQAGLIAGILLLILVAWLTDKSLRMIVDLATFHPKLRKLNCHTYEDLMSYPFGKLGSGFVLFNMFILAYGAMVAYLLIIKDTIPTIIGWNQGWQREVVLIITSLVIIVPLSMQRDMASLAFTSLLSVSADAILVLFIALASPVGQSVSEAGGFGPVLRNESVNPTIFIGLGILSTAMACQHSAFIISGSLVNKTRARWAAVTYRSLFCATFLCLVMGIFGYLGFLEDTRGDILNNFAEDSVVANGARALLAITMFFTYPVESFVARHVLVKLIHNGDMDGDAEQAANEEESPTRPGFLCMGRRTTWTLFIYIITMIPALLVTDLGPVLSITGALGGSCVAYMAPGLVYLGVHGEEFLEMIHNFLNNRRGIAKEHSPGEIELPVAGDSDAVMQAPQVTTASSSTSTNGMASTRGMDKPWWWWLALMPIWCAVASTGGINTREKLARSGVDFDAPSTTQNARLDVTVDGEHLDEEDDLVATKWDIAVSIFFIVFGVVALVAGIISNVYVIINNVFFTVGR